MRFVVTEISSIFTSAAPACIELRVSATTRARLRGSRGAGLASDAIISLLTSPRPRIMLGEMSYSLPILPGWPSMDPAAFPLILYASTSEGAGVILSYLNCSVFSLTSRVDSTTARPSTCRSLFHIVLNATDPRSPPWYILQTTARRLYSSTTTNTTTTPSFPTSTHGQPSRLPSSVCWPPIGGGPVVVWSVLGAKVMEILQKYPACNNGLLHALYVT
jgi:hypothetical protein